MQGKQENTGLSKNKVTASFISLPLLTAIVTHGGHAKGDRDDDRGDDDDDGNTTKNLQAALQRLSHLMLSPF